VLEKTDVLVWWGHMAHEEVRDDIAEKVQRRVLEGMGLIVLHSGHGSKVFHRLLGTQTGQLKWRDDGEKERLWVIEHSHPIVEGLGEYIELPKEEMYGERFDIPAPDELIFISWFEGGEVFRSGCCYQRGRGKLFYFRPGHETFPIYHHPDILRVIGNAVRWAAPVRGAASSFGRVQPLEPVRVPTTVQD
jgi:trehalose utilization protein